MSNMDLRDKMEALAIRIADALLGTEVELEQRIDGLKTLSGYYAAVKRADRDSPQSAGRWGQLQRTLNGAEEEDYGEAG